MQKKTSKTLLSLCFLVLLNTISFGQPQQKFPDFQPGYLTSEAATNYLSSVFDQKIPDSVQILALGEVSHGNYGPIAYKAAMIKYLVEKKKYRKILFEQSDIAGLRTMRKYLNDNKSIDTAYIRNWVKNWNYPSAIGPNYADLFKWIKDYNLKHPKDQVEVMGFEVGIEKAAIDIILYNYIIPFDIKESQKMVYKLHASATDADKVKVLQQWFTANETGLKTRLDKSSFDWLHYHIRNAVNGANYLIKNSQDTDKTSKLRSNLHRDSLLAENVRFLSGNEKCIISAHNAHVIKTEWKYMGNYLKQIFKGKYYVIATDFSGVSTTDVVNTQSGLSNPIYLNRTFKSKPATAAAQMLHDFGISNGIFFNEDLIKMKTGNATNVIDVYGIHELLSSFAGSLDALVMFHHIFPDK